MIKNITLSAENSDIEKGRRKAKREGKSLNLKFREWLNQYINSKDRRANYYELMNELSHISAGKTFTREEANKL